jgi:tRNA G18 (ribose-2'-O)-methylase SpoU
VNAATAAITQPRVITAITGRGSRNRAGNSGGSIGLLLMLVLWRRVSATVIDISDPGDPRLDDFRDLNSVDRRPDLPTGKALVIAEGVLVVQRMLASRFRAFALLGTERRREELADDLTRVDIPYYRVSAEVMARVVGFHLNRGVLAAARRPPSLTVADVLAGATTAAVLEGVNDHENLGSIFRNAAGLGVDAVVFGAGCADPLYRRAVRVSMGHALLVPYARAGEWPADLDVLRESGFRLLAMTPDPTAATLADAMAQTRDARVAVMVGAEGPGLTRAALRAADLRVRIPMAGGTDSLNVATAAALAFYERARSDPRKFVG